jgi:DNA repair photolyase
MTKKKISGTLEWAKVSLNIHLGCVHRCRYCYARERTVRLGKCDSETWGTTYNQLKERPFTGFSKKYDGVVMFPTAHDLTPDILPETLEAIQRLTKAGNNILLVSKPYMEVIKAICEKFAEQKDQIQFRFTIGAYDDNILAYWEPGAPTYAERFNCLKYAWEQGFQTSVSVEPMLDSKNVVELFHKLEPWITGTFWIGKMNHVRTRVQPDTDPQEIARIEMGQTDERVHEIYNILKDEPKIRWKESFKSVLGLPLATEAGTDI